KAGSVVVPCTLESNVKALYEYLYDETDYTPSDTVKSISKSVKQNSGLDEKDALNYGYGTELTEDEGSSVK
ncbi:MAG: LytR family transcriptional regulator, partial [Lachnospiraceae bacterium]|nr:LytR family transcriptional regulator [Lachnospiraceae bacterium]